MSTAKWQNIAGSKKFFSLFATFWIFSVAKEALGVLEIATLSEDEMDPNKKKSRIVSEECKGCLSSVGMAVWHCGTFEMDCIKGKYYRIGV